MNLKITCGAVGGIPGIGLAVLVVFASCGLYLESTPPGLILSCRAHQHSNVHSTFAYCKLACLHLLQE